MLKFLGLDKKEVDEGGNKKEEEIIKEKNVDELDLKETSETILSPVEDNTIETKKDSDLEINETPETQTDLHFELLESETQLKNDPSSPVSESTQVSSSDALDLEEDNQNGVEKKEIEKGNQEQNLKLEEVNTETNTNAVPKETSEPETDAAIREMNEENAQESTLEEEKDTVSKEQTTEEVNVKETKISTIKDSIIESIPLVPEKKEEGVNLNDETCNVGDANDLETVKMEEEQVSSDAGEETIAKETIQTNETETDEKETEAQFISSPETMENGSEDTKMEDKNKAQPRTESTLLVSTDNQDSKSDEQTSTITSEEQGDKGTENVPREILNSGTNTDLEVSLKTDVDAPEELSQDTLTTSMEPTSALVEEKETENNDFHKCSIINEEPVNDETKSNEASSSDANNELSDTNSQEIKAPESEEIASSDTDPSLTFEEKTLKQSDISSEDTSTDDHVRGIPEEGESAMSNDVETKNASEQSQAPIDSSEGEEVLNTREELLEQDSLGKSEIQKEQAKEIEEKNSSESDVSTASETISNILVPDHEENTENEEKCVIAETAEEPRDESVVSLDEEKNNKSMESIEPDPIVIKSEESETVDTLHEKHVEDSSDSSITERPDSDKSSVTLKAMDLNDLEKSTNDTLDEEALKELAQNASEVVELNENSIPLASEASEVINTKESLEVLEKNTENISEESDNSALAIESETRDSGKEENANSEEHEIVQDVEEEEEGEEVKNDLEAKEPIEISESIVEMAEETEEPSDLVAEAGLEDTEVTEVFEPQSANEINDVKEITALSIGNEAEIAPSVENQLKTEETGMDVNDTVQETLEEKELQLSSESFEPLKDSKVKEDITGAESLAVKSLVEASATELDMVSEKEVEVQVNPEDREVLESNEVQEVEVEASNTRDTIDAEKDPIATSLVDSVVCHEIQKTEDDIEKDAIRSETNENNPSPTESLDMNEEVLLSTNNIEQLSNVRTNEEDVAPNAEESVESDLTETQNDNSEISHEEDTSNLEEHKVEEETNLEEASQKNVESILATEDEVLVPNADKVSEEATLVSAESKLTATKGEQKLVEAETKNPEESESKAEDSSNIAHSEKEMTLEGQNIGQTDVLQVVLDKALSVQGETVTDKGKVAVDSQKEIFGLSLTEPTLVANLETSQERPEETDNIHREVIGKANHNFNEKHVNFSLVDPAEVKSQIKQLISEVNQDERKYISSPNSVEGIGFLTSNLPKEASPSLKRLSAASKHLYLSPSNNTFNEAYLVDIVTNKLKLDQGLQVENVRAFAEPTLNDVNVFKEEPLLRANNIGSIHGTTFQPNVSTAEQFQSKRISTSLMEETKLNPTSDDAVYDEIPENGKESLQTSELSVFESYLTSEEPVNKAESFVIPPYLFSQLLNCVMTHPNPEQSAKLYLTQKKSFSYIFMLIIIIILFPFIMFLRLINKVSGKGASKNCLHCGWESQDSNV